MNEAKEVAEATCCGGAAPEGSGACCVADAEAKAAGESGCGCNEQSGSTASCCEPRTVACCS